MLVFQGVGHSSKYVAHPKIGMEPEALGPGSLRSVRRSVQRLQKGLRRAWSPLGGRLSPQCPAQCPETAEVPAARVVELGARDYWCQWHAGINLRFFFQRLMISRSELSGRYLFHRMTLHFASPAVPYSSTVHSSGAPRPSPSIPRQQRCLQGGRLRPAMVGRKRQLVLGAGVCGRWVHTEGEV